MMEGNSKVMVSAPHAVEHTREGKIRYPEPETAQLAKQLHERLDCPIIYKTANAEDDANYDEKCSYKEALAAYVREHDIRFLIDLHQMAGFRKEQICIGTGYGRNLTEDFDLEACRTPFKERGLEVSIDSPFAASYPYTVAAYIHRECGIPCLQIEINSNLLREGNGLYAYEQVLEVLEQLVSNQG
ncbi:MAG: N-formylglutamate amidohydrolase [Lachnospiraceae bacterium]|nr:N-formylglutamate amidohydrolase [Lachnospiraceae bacterium]